MCFNRFIAVAHTVVGTGALCGSAYIGYITYDTITKAVELHGDTILVLGAVAEATASLVLLATAAGNYAAAYSFFKRASNSNPETAKLLQVSNSLEAGSIQSTSANRTGIKG